MNKELGYLVVGVGASALAVAPLDLHDFPLDPRLVPWRRVWVSCGPATGSAGS